MTTRTLTASDLRYMLRAVRDVETLTNAMRATARIPTATELYDAAGGIRFIREKLLSVCVCDVEVEAVEQKKEVV